MVDTYIIVVYK